MGESIVHTLGIIPAIVFPCAALVQLLQLLKRGYAGSVSALAWWLFAVANICLYIYTQKYLDWVAIVAFLGTASLNIAVALTVTRLRKANLEQ